MPSVMESVKLCWPGATAGVAGANALAANFLGRLASFGRPQDQGSVLRAMAYVVGTSLLAGSGGLEGWRAAQQYNSRRLSDVHRARAGWTPGCGSSRRPGGQQARVLIALSAAMIALSTARTMSASSLGRAVRRAAVGASLSCMLP